MDGIKAGFKTTEFWLTVLAQVPTVIGLFVGQTNPITVGIGAACVIAYNVLRSAQKTVVAKAAILAAVQAAAEATKPEVK